MKAFIAHSSKDKLFVRKLKKDLELNNILTWMDEDELDVGDTLLDKLIEGIKDSTHLIIVLSQNSVESPWVLYELKNAINTSKKIIPIKYKECIIPFELEKLFYLDLSKEIVEHKGDSLEFVTDGYKQELVKLIRGLKTNKYELKIRDKKEIQDKVEGQKQSQKSNILRIFLRVIGYTKEGKRKWNKILKDEGTQKPVPVLLPPLTRKMHFKVGDLIKIKFNENISMNAHFAGYRRDDLKIALPIEVRNSLKINNYSIYVFEFNLKTKFISILSD